uniref:TSA: Wollemia nobilis Ref_Wollemi_Transcript_14528_1396 transcribed RNA sequence n=1 Tax=Wollemia nobilis TaxID=56998 RepID=A0A0C9RJJ3_9CONI
MASQSCLISCVFLLLVCAALPSQTRAENSREVIDQIKRVNARGESIGVVVSGNDELDVMMEDRLFVPFRDRPSVALSNRRYHVGDIAGRRAIVVMSGSGMANAAEATQLLLTHFNVRTVVHYGRASNANPKEVNIGDVVIPKEFADCGVWHLETFGGDEGKYRRDIAKLTFADFNVEKAANSLESAYFQPQELGNGEEKFFINVDNELYDLARKMEESVNLDKCEEGTDKCLERQPRVRRVESGCSGNIDVNNVAYRDFLRNNLEITSIDYESAAIASVCVNERRRFLAMLSSYDFAGGFPRGKNDLKVIQELWRAHLRESIGALFNLLPKADMNLRSVTGSKIW